VLDASTHAGGAAPALGVVGNNSAASKTLLLIYR
jgi:hypothetical protein